MNSKSHNKQHKMYILFEQKVPANENTSTEKTSLKGKIFFT